MQEKVKSKSDRTFFIITIMKKHKMSWIIMTHFLEVLDIEKHALVQINCNSSKKAVCVHEINKRHMVLMHVVKLILNVVQNHSEMSKRCRMLGFFLIICLFFRNHACKDIKEKKLC